MARMTSVDRTAVWQQRLERFSASHQTVAGSYFGAAELAFFSLANFSHSESVRTYREQERRDKQRNSPAQILQT